MVVVNEDGEVILFGFGHVKTRTNKFSDISEYEVNLADPWEKWGKGRSQFSLNSRRSILLDPGHKESEDFVGVHFPLKFQITDLDFKEGVSFYNVRVHFFFTKKALSLFKFVLLI